MSLVQLFTLIGVAVFAASGALAAVRRSLDPIGVLVLAIVTATGGDGHGPILRRASDSGSLIFRSFTFWRAFLVVIIHSHHPFMKLRHSLTLCAACLFLAIASAASADQFVLFDVTFPFTKADADNAMPSKSHYYVKGGMLNAQRPKDWTAPVDYRNGSVHVRLEVIEKPAGSAPTTWSVCYIPNKGQNHGYGCIGTGVYTDTGIVEKDIAMTSFWQNNDIIWSEGIKEMHLVLKDDHNLHAHKRPDPEKFFPTKVRMMLIQVSKGAKYDPKLVPALK